MQDFDDPGEFQVAFCLECRGLFIKHSPCTQIQMYSFSGWIKMCRRSHGVVGKMHRSKQQRD